MPTVVHQLKIPAEPSTQGVSIPSRGHASGMRWWLAFIAREPFFQFAMLGLVIWSGVEFWSTDHSRYTIHIGPAEWQRIATTYLQQYGQPPTSAQLRGLIDRQIREEIFLREGLALHLDQGDEIVRRRIVQKYEFLQTDLAVADPPPAEALERWFDENKPRYETPERVAFSQVYFSVDHQSEEAAQSRATRALEKLRGMGVSRAPDLGDAFPGPADVSAVSPEEARRLFGESDLSQALFKLPMGQWSGPYRSGYGWHLIYVTGLTPPALPALTDIRGRALADYLEEERRNANAVHFEKLRAQYTIRYDGTDR
jgi:peptidyl-prolyl cis-trans isomerase C